MTERDELAKLAFIADNHAAGDPHAEWEFLQQHPKYTQYVYEIADAIMAADYRKPRTITTREELEALPHGSVIRSEHRHYWVAHKEDGAEGNQGWAAAGMSGVPSDLTAWLPATVLYEPAEVTA